MPKLHERIFERLKEVPSAFKAFKQYVKNLYEEIRENLRKDPSYLSRLKSLFRKDYIENITEPSDLCNLLCCKFLISRKMGEFDLLGDAQRDVERLYLRHRLNEVGIPLDMLLSAPIDYGGGRSVSNPLLDKKRKEIFRIIQSLYPDLYKKLVIYHGLLTLSQLDEREEPLILSKLEWIAKNKSREADKFAREKFGINFTTLYQAVNPL